MGAIGTILFVTEIIIENIHLATKRSKIKSLEREIVDLKAKLYDKASNEAAPSLPAEDPVQESNETSEKPKEE